jgi:hypothetical protein
MARRISRHGDVLTELAHLTVGNGRAVGAQRAKVNARALVHVGGVAGVRDQAPVAHVDREAVLVRLDLLPAERVAEHADACDDQAFGERRTGRDQIRRDRAEARFGTGRGVREPRPDRGVLRDQRPGGALERDLGAAEREARRLGAELITRAPLSELTADEQAGRVARAQ